jgi:PTS system cellobiose-specific IIC component
MQTKIVMELVRFNQHSFIRVTRQTLAALFPWALVASFSCLIEKSFLNANGFFYNILVINAWLPLVWQRVLQYIFTSITSVIFSLLGIFACYFNASHTARLYKKNNLQAGMTAVVTLLLLAYRYGKNPQQPLDFHLGLLGGKSLLLCLVLGYGVGQLYRRFVPVYDEQLVSDRSISCFWPLLISLAAGVLSAAIINSGAFYRLYAGSYSQLVTASQDPHNPFLTCLFTIVLGLMDWLGLGMPVSYSGPANTPAYVANLNYALTHGSAWNVPYKFLGSTLYNSFANFGGDGLVLALIVAILLFPGNTGTHRVARWSAVPTLFNFDYSSLIGLPIILNPVFLVPFIFLPVINLLLATAMIALHLLPATPYPVLLGTPGPLLGFIATNGNWATLAFTIVLLLVDVFAYTPFVRMAFAVENELVREATESGEQHD